MFPFVVYADSPGTIGRFFLQRFKYRPRSYCLRSANVRRQAEKMIKGDELMKKKILLIVLCLRFTASRSSLTAALWRGAI